MTTRLLLVLLCGIGVSGCATLTSSLDLAEPSARFQAAEREDETAVEPAELPPLPMNACETITCPPGQTIFTDAQMDALMLFVDTADANTRIAEKLSGEVSARERRINALLDMGMLTEKEAGLYRQGWEAEYRARLLEGWTLRIGLGIAILGLVVQ